jgi:hypothetical protein
VMPKQTKAEKAASARALDAKEHQQQLRSDFYRRQVERDRQSAEAASAPRRKRRKR